MIIQIKRVYDPVEKTDGSRVLVDRVWPRGLSKKKLQVDLWLKDAAPSNDLRKWLAHDRSRWKTFKKRCHADLEQHANVLDQLLELTKEGTITLLFSARDTRCNQAVALKEFMVSITGQARTVEQEPSPKESEI